MVSQANTAGHNFIAAAIQLSKTDYFVRNTAYLFKRTRVLRGLSLKQASVLTDIQENVISRLETGGQYANIDTYVKMAEGYGLPYHLVFKKYDTVPTRQEWQHLKILARILGYHKRSKNKKAPLAGTQLELQF